MERHIQSVIAAKAEAAARAEEVAKAAAMEEDIRAVEELSSQQQLVAANRHNAAKKEKLPALKRATPEATHMLLAVQQGSSPAGQTLQVLNLRDSRKGSEVALVAEELQKRNAVIDEDVAARKRSAVELMNRLAFQQGLAAPHPDLLEETDVGN